MINLKRIFTLAAVSLTLGLGATSVTRAGELDPAIEGLLPHNLLVRVNNSTNETTVFRAYSNNKVASSDEALALITDAEKANMKVETTALSELDRDSSKAAWCYYYAPNYWGYNYSYAYYYRGYNYAYTPYYYYRYSYYSYYYYWY